MMAEARRGPVRRYPPAPGRRRPHQTEAAAVHPTGQWRASLTSARTRPRYRAAAEAVTRGARLTAQIGHEGQIRSTHTGLPLWSASAVPCPVNREMPKEMELEDIREVVAAYAAAATRMKRAGLDAVTIHGLHNTYFLGQFASPWVNRRTDAYGGSFDNRLRIVGEVVRAVRDAVGPDFTVGLQMSGDDFDPRGLSADDYTEIARRLDATAALDWIMVGGAVRPELRGARHAAPRPPGSTPAARIRPWCGTSVGVVGRSTLAGEGIVRGGQADLIAKTRQHIADPETVAKLRRAGPTTSGRASGATRGASIRSTSTTRSPAR
jgi:2,4-dienoyl-CoA reductase-like NADH-dependent reductase (Old Yellow Enzyme family)